MAFSGAVLMISLGETGLPDLERANPAGYLFILVCILVASGATIYVRKNLIHYDTFDVASIRMFSASTLLIIFGFFWSGLDTTRVILSGYIILLVGGVSSFFIALVNFYTIKRFGASKTSMADYFTLVVASIGGMVLFHEKFTPGILAGIVLILCGVIMINTVSTTPVKSHETAS